MSLIKCTECGNEVSSYASACPKCGCPVQKMVDMSENCLKLFDIRVDDITNNDQTWIRGFINQMLGIDSSISRAMIGRLPSVIIKGVSSQTANEIQRLLGNEGCSVSTIVSGESSERYTLNNVKATGLYKKYQPLTCPRCGSTAVTTGSRGYSLVWGFAGSNKTVNRCGKCGYTWKP